MFTYIHGISWNDVKDKPTFKDVWNEIKASFEGIDFLAAHNAGFDSGVLKACCLTYGINPPTTPFKCSMALARKTWNIRPTKLSDVCNHLNIELNHHEALSDAHACAQIIMASQILTVPKVNMMET
jgi:DNA polymerase-3 subunit epsilon